MTHRINLRICLVTSVLLPLTLSTSVMGETIYVDDNAVGSNNGSSWMDACLCLQNALAVAQSGDEIRVAQGIYKPDQRLVVSRLGRNVQGSGDRTATFQLFNGVTIKGGYTGYGELDPDARDVELYETILSGDLNGDDSPGFQNNAENSYHVVTGSGTNETAVLDGFMITAGNADGSSPNQKGGGMDNYSGSPTVVNYTFCENSATSGGGMSNGNDSSPTVMACTFSSNSAANNGGGMRNQPDSHPNLTNCTFSGNYSDSGGGTYNDNSSPTLTTCTFSNNSFP